MKQSRSIMVCFAVAVLVSCIVLFPSGCRKEKPKGLIEKVDEAIGNIDSTLDQLSKDLDNLVNTLNAGTQLTIALVEQMYNTIKAETLNIVSQVKSARDEARKVAGMEGVPEYRKYAQIQEEMLDNAVAITNTLSDLFDELSSASKALKEGKAPDSSRLAKTAESLSKELKNLKKQGEVLRERARKLKEEKRL